MYEIFVVDIVIVDNPGPMAVIYAFSIASHLIVNVWVCRLLFGTPNDAYCNSDFLANRFLWNVLAAYASTRWPFVCSIPIVCRYTHIYPINHYLVVVYRWILDTNRMLKTILTSYKSKTTQTINFRTEIYAYLLVIPHLYGILIGKRRKNSKKTL